MTDCQFEAFGIAFNAKHRGTFISAMKNVFKVCNTAAVASTLSCVEMVENQGRGSKYLLVALEMAQSKCVAHNNNKNNNNNTF